MSHVALKSLGVCLTYGIISILQTLNSRYIFRTLNFEYYSFVFAIQRIFIIIIFLVTVRHTIRKAVLVKVLPYSLIACCSNVISSYSLTIMPLAAFMAFKKFVVLFILGVSLAFSLPNTTTRLQNYCIVGIVVGGALVGEKDMLMGNFLAYMVCMGFDLLQALSLQYSNYLYRSYRVQPTQLLLYNCMISLPYYITAIAFESQFDDIYNYLSTNICFSFVVVLLLSVLLACIAELSSSHIAMKISPFQKSIVSNIKDLILMIISVVYLKDYAITAVSGLGIVMCLTSSIIFSLPFLEEKHKPIAISQNISLSLGPDNTSLMEQHIHLEPEQQSHSELNEHPAQMQESQSLTIKPSN